MKEMEKLKFPIERDQEITVRLTGWIDKDLKCQILGLEELDGNKVEYVLPINEIQSLGRRIEMEQARGIIFDDNLDCLEGQIISIIGLLHGVRFRYDLMNLEKDKDKDKNKEYEWNCEIDWIKKKLVEWYKFE